jgi:hypothetical protein
MERWHVMIWSITHILSEDPESLLILEGASSHRHLFEHSYDLLVTGHRLYVRALGAWPGLSDGERFDVQPCDTPCTFWDGNVFVWCTCVCVDVICSTCTIIDPFAGLHSCMYPLKMHALNITDFVQAFFFQLACVMNTVEMLCIIHSITILMFLARMHMWKNEMGISTENFVVLWLNKITISIIANSFTSVCFYNYIVGFEKAFIQTHFDLFFLAV